jgi:hypothetical protein
LFCPAGTGSASPEQQQRGKAAALAFLLFSSGLSVWECWRLWAEVAHSQEASAVQALPHSIQVSSIARWLICRCRQRLQG